MRGFSFGRLAAEYHMGNTVAIASESIPSAFVQPEARRRTFVIGVLGCGTVGGGVVDRLLADRRDRSGPRSASAASSSEI